MAIGDVMLYRDGNQAVNDVLERIGLSGSNLSGSHLPSTMVNARNPIDARGGVA
jgi:hypothetical protein